MTVTVHGQAELVFANTVSAILVFDIDSITVEELELRLLNPKFHSELCIDTSF